MTNKLAPSAIIYHDNCLDGFASAVVANQLLEFSYLDNRQNVDILSMPFQYGDKPNLNALAGRSVYIVDFSFPNETLLAMAESCEKVVVIDHHLKAINELSKLKKIPDNLEIKTDINHSGCVLTWKHFHGNESKVPDMLRYIEDRDLWRFELNLTKRINAALWLCNRDFAAWQFMLNNWDNHVDDLIIMGSNVLKANDAMVKQQVRDLQVFAELGYHRYTHFACNASVLPSETADYILKEMDVDFAAIYYLDGHNVKFSLRSRPGSDIDVNQVAIYFGGGGHKNAAGFTISVQEFSNWLYMD